MTKQDMRFGVIREKIVLEGNFEFDGKLCHVRNMPTSVSTDATRRYCSNIKCNALIVEEI